MCLPLPKLDSRRLAKGEHLGFAWEIVHNEMGYRCGYVRVSPGHPWFGMSYNDIEASVHGGLTFAASGTACAEHGPLDEWWLGFDCAHGGDAPDWSLPWENEQVKRFMLSMEKDFDEWHPEFQGVRERLEKVRDTAYVQAECVSLCEQARAAQQPQPA